MTNENAIFEISRLKYRNNALPVPLFNKSRKIVFKSLKNLLIYRERNNFYHEIKNVFKSNINRMRKIFVYLFWIYMAEKF